MREYLRQLWHGVLVLCCVRGETDPYPWHDDEYGDHELGGSDSPWSAQNR